MIRFCVWCMVMVFGVMGDCLAAEQNIVFDTDDSKISVSSDFNGQELVVFGTKPGDGDLVVVVEGPKRDTIVRHKERVMGAWMNMNSQRLEDVPLFYEYALGGSHAADYDLKRLLFGDGGEEVAVSSFRDAFLRIKRRQGLFSVAPNEVKFYEDGRLFRADFVIPSNVPVGDYMVYVDYYDGDEVLHRSRVFKVEQIGLNAQLRRFSVDYSFLYGVSCVGLALFAGWFSDKIKRRQ